MAEKGCNLQFFHQYITPAVNHFIYNEQTKVSTKKTNKKNEINRLFLLMEEEATSLLLFLQFLSTIEKRIQFLNLQSYA